MVTIDPGAGVFAGSYTLTPGSDTGWRAQPGISMLAVTAGTLRVVQARGCTARECHAPDVAVLPAGTIHLSNAGDVPVAFAGFFDSLPESDARPLVDGPEAKAPRGCAAGPAYRPASTGLAAVEIARGLFTPDSPHPGHQDQDEIKRLAVTEGGDVVMLTIQALPGTSRGWSRHGPGLAIVTKGQLDTYVPTDTGCAKVEHLGAGHAAAHTRYGDHLSVVTGNEPLEATLIYWGMGKDRLPMPGLVDFAEANDFTPALPAGCTVL